MKLAPGFEVIYVRTEIEKLESRPETRRLLREEQLILEVTEALADSMERSNVTKSELAKRLGRSKSFVSQLMSGGRNLTLRTLADVAEALNMKVNVTLSDSRSLRPRIGLDSYHSWLEIKSEVKWPVAGTRRFVFSATRRSDEVNSLSVAA